MFKIELLNSLVGFEFVASGLRKEIRKIQLDAQIIKPSGIAKDNFAISPGTNSLKTIWQYVLG